ncbi:MAG: hypothetical protein JWR04_2593 [Rhodoglobus sp.]|jgi:hypothetical protein|nr:hypothetical protein [Rhodoglobus sp.]
MSITPPPSTPDSSVPVPPPATKQGNPVGLGSLIVGAVAFLFAIIPFLSFIAWVPALVAIGLAIAGLVAKNRKKVTPAIGLALGILAIIVGLIVSLVGIATVASSVKDDMDQAEEAASVLVPLVYEVSGDTATASNITYSTYDDNNSGTSQVADAPLPWSITSDVERGGAFDFNIYSLSASTGADGGTISCKITIDGKVISENTATGAYAFAMCSGSTSDLDD